MSNQAIKVGDHDDDQPSFFTGSSFAVSEIVIGMSVLSRKVRDLKEANDKGRAVDQKLMAEQISKLAGQIQVLADVITRVTCSHLARKPR